MGRRSILLYYKYGKIVRIQIKGHFMADINLKQLKDNYGKRRICCVPELTWRLINTVSPF